MIIFYLIVGLIPLFLVFLLIKFIFNKLNFIMSHVKNHDDKIKKFFDDVSTIAKNSNKE